MFQTRAGPAALELNPDGPYAGPLLEAVSEVARLGAYAAHEVLPPAARAALSAERADALSTAITLRVSGPAPCPRTTGSLCPRPSPSAKPN
ncbi:hypothetical protein SHXM_07878 [Streptomyces hygroscopicus]|nr:hypothetical protein SHXM_07878 [Streptomyces hygroscopicus]